jgi:mannose-1-phosphate guanylyltransferase
MIQTTVDRIAPIIPIEQTLFASNQEYAELIKAQIPTIPERNIIKEPSPKHTAPCIGLGALHIQQFEVEAVMASLHADHFIVDEQGFRQALLAAEQVAREGYLVTLGITPTKPETGYGYIERGPKLGEYNGYTAYRIDRFLEKPNLATAQRFLASGTYYWNSGIFIWQISTLMSAFKSYMPDLHEKLGQLSRALATGQPITPIWHEITPESIDVGIMEKAEQVAVIPVDIGWNDVGSWAAIHDIAPVNKDGNVILGSNQLVFDTTGSLIHAQDRLIAVVGLKDVIIVDTGDALLVCAKEKAQDVKKVVTWLQEHDRSELL